MKEKVQANLLFTSAVCAGRLSKAKPKKYQYNSAQGLVHKVNLQELVHTRGCVTALYLESALRLRQQTRVLGSVKMQNLVSEVQILQFTSPVGCGYGFQTYAEEIPTGFCKKGLLTQLAFKDWVTSEAVPGLWTWKVLCD